VVGVRHQSAADDLSLRSHHRRTSAARLRGPRSRPSGLPAAARIARAIRATDDNAFRDAVRIIIQLATGGLEIVHTVEFILGILGSMAAQGPLLK
jgi:hypothetical protein